MKKTEKEKSSLEGTNTYTGELASLPIPGRAIPCRDEHDMSRMADIINHPNYYSSSSIEAIDVIESWQLDFCLGNVVKYVARWNKKGNHLDNLRKAQWYLQRKIQTLEKGLTPLSLKKVSLSSSEE
jgi:hypothetical protein